MEQDPSPFVFHLPRKYFNVRLKNYYFLLPINFFLREAALDPNNL